MMNIFIASGTFNYLNSLKEKHPEETLILMQNIDTSLLLHETNNKSFFKQPRKYEIIHKSGAFEDASFAVMNHIAVSDEGRPVFEYRVKHGPHVMNQEPGFKALRVLRPLTSDTYVILTLWQDEKSYKRWYESKATNKNEDIIKEINATKDIFPRPSYVTKFIIANKELDQE